MKVNSQFYKYFSGKILQITRLWMPCPAVASGAAGAVMPLGDTSSAYVTSSVQYGEFDSSHAGQEMLITIIAYNLTADDPFINFGFNGNPLTESLGDADGRWTTIYGANPEDPINLAGDGENVAAGDRLEMQILSYATEVAQTGQMSITGAGNGLGSTNYGIFTIWNPIPEAAPNIGDINTAMSTTSNSLHIINLGICTTNFLSPHTNTTFQIAVTTNLFSGAWTTNSTKHSITGAVTTVTLTNTADRAFFRIIAE